MTIASLRIRRSLTVVGAGAALILGFAAIQAASAWTAQAAPLTVSSSPSAPVASLEVNPDLMIADPASAAADRDALRKPLL